MCIQHWQWTALHHPVGGASPLGAPTKLHLNWQRLDILHTWGGRCKLHQLFGHFGFGGRLAATAGFRRGGDHFRLDELGDIALDSFFGRGAIGGDHLVHQEQQSDVDGDRQQDCQDHFHVNPLVSRQPLPHW